MLLKYVFPFLLLVFGVSCLPPSALLGAKECTWGPSYWCKNITSAHKCNAVRHCISSVWEQKTPPADGDDVCTICKNMVAEARDQLESNETMDELKQVFEGSCKLIYVKPAVRICKKLADELVPELVDTISSQMNPDMVCTVAGLCNNQEIDDAIEEDQKSKESNGELVKVKIQKENCDICERFMNRTDIALKSASSEERLSYMLDICGKTSSFSDSCASIVLDSFPMLEKALEDSLPLAYQLCASSGSCSSLRKTSGIKDEACDLCKQLILHLKDTLTADTTEAEFKQVLEGVCKQTKKFSAECTSLVDQYYDEIYKIIVQDLDGQTICGFFNICPAPGVYFNGPIAPLLPVQPISVDNTVMRGKLTTEKDTTVRPTIAYGDTLNATPQLPLMLINPSISLQSDLDVNNEQTCMFCQYLLHYVQKVITQPYGEDAIKKVVDDVCDKLPKSISVQCREFVNLYGDAFVAILAQEIDPSQLCPSLKVCPAVELEDRYEPKPLLGKPGCPLCLMVISALDEELTNNKTEENIRESLEQLCNKLPKAILKQCDTLVTTYTEELVDMIVADFTPEQVCEYLKICKSPNLVESVTVRGGLEVTQVVEEDPIEVLTNEIPQTDPEQDKTLIYVQEDKTAEKKSSPTCILCEFVMEKVDELIKNNKSQADMDKVLRGVCDHLPRTIRKDCNQFVVKYAEEIVNTLAIFVEPSMVCSYLGMCLKSSIRNFEQMTKDCAMCETIAAIEVPELDNVELARVNFLTKTCPKLDERKLTECRQFMRNRGISLFNAFVDGAKSDDVCQKLAICSSATSAKVEMTKRTPELIGANKCTHGPTYWCQSRDIARTCGTGAVKHCQDNVWN